MIVAFTGFLFFSLLTALGWWLWRSFIHPAVALSSIWTLEFLSQILSIGTFYPVSWMALAIFVIGALSFAGGAGLVDRGGSKWTFAIPVNMWRARNDRVILWLFVLILISLLPTYMKYIADISGTSLLSSKYFLYARQGFLKQAIELNRAPLVANVVVLSSIFAMIAYAITDAGRRFRILVWALVAFALFYNLSTAAKGGVISLVVALFLIHVVLRRRIPVRFLLLAAVGVLLLFGVVTVGRVRALNIQLTWQQAVIESWDTFLTYFSGSPVAFSLWLEHPDWVDPVWSPWSFFMRTANYFGNYFYVPNPNANFVNVGSGIYVNTYTAYFSYYPEYGIGGVVAFMVVLGAVCAAIYKQALDRKIMWLAAYGIVFYGILMSIFGESLLTGLNGILKVVIVALLVERLRHLRVRKKSVQRMQRFGGLT